MSNGYLPTTLYNVKLNSYPPSYCSQLSKLGLQDWNSEICAGN